MTSELMITVLNDNLAGRKLLAEHGFSFYIETSNAKVLLDTGFSDVFVKNAEVLNLDLSERDTIVLSHGHWDHADGLRYISGGKLITHPDVFIQRYHGKRDDAYVGMTLKKEDLSRKFDLILSKEPVWISDSVVYLGEIPSSNDFERESTAFTKEDGSEDYIMDDSAIAIKTSKGLVVISGCAHSGICNTIEYACKVTGDVKVHAVLGGFHLKHANDITSKTISYLIEKGVDKVIPSHCTAFPALQRFAEVFKFNQVKTGDVFRF